MRVLLVEDDELVRICLLDLLSDAGIETMAVVTANEALENAARLDDLGVLVSDVWLGFGMDGIALAQTARRRWPEIRVILMTGSTEWAETAEPTGYADTVLLQPFGRDAFVSAVLQANLRHAGQNRPADVH